MRHNGFRMRSLPLSAAFALLLVSMVLLAAEHGTEHKISTGTMGAAMGMYKAAPLSGCDDYHCLKCPSRDYCSVGGRCGMPDCGHEHAVVECHGCSVLYLRAAAGFTSVMDRAAEVVNAMNAVMTLERPEEWHFAVRESSLDPEIWLEMKGMQHGKKIVSVTNADVLGYKYRAKVIPMSYPADVINQLLVAKWWAALLQDHFDAMVLGIPPTRTVETHCGKPLLKAYEAARMQVEEGPIPMETWKRIFSTELSPTDRDRLELVAQIIPKTFSP